MVFARLNGFTLPVSNDSVRRTSEPIGRPQEGYRNAPIIRRRKFVLGWSLETTIQSADAANGLEGLIDGVGHHWPFDVHLWSDDGQGPESGFTATINPSGGKFDGHASITSITYDVDLGPEFTITVFRLESSVWNHYAIRSDGVKYFQGIRNDGKDTSWLTTDPAVGRFAIGGSPTGYDDLVFVPYHMSTLQIEAHFTWQDTDLNPFSKLPILTLDGDIIPNKTIRVNGEVGAEPFLQHGALAGGSSPTNNARTISFRLDQHDEAGILIPGDPFADPDAEADTNFDSGWDGT